MAHKPCKHKSGKTRIVGPHNTYWWHGDCEETEDSKGWAVESTCEYGNCLNWDCPVCGCNRYGGVGPVDCPCDDTVPYYEMRYKRPVANKPSLGTNGRRRRKTRRT